MTWILLWAITSTGSGDNVSASVAEFNTFQDCQIAIQKIELLEWPWTEAKGVCVPKGVPQ